MTVYVYLGNGQEIAKPTLLMKVSTNLSTYIRIKVNDLACKINMIFTNFDLLLSLLLKIFRHSECNQFKKKHDMKTRNIDGLKDNNE